MYFWLFLLRHKQVSCYPNSLKWIKAGKGETASKSYQLCTLPTPPCGLHRWDTCHWNRWILNSFNPQEFLICKMATVIYRKVSIREYGWHNTTQQLSFCSHAVQVESPLLVWLSSVSSSTAPVSPGSGTPVSPPQGQCPLGSLRSS